MSEHWLDRLARRQTRRHVLARGLGALAMTLPFARVARAAPAEGSSACRRGCFYASHRQCAARLASCQAAARSGAVSSAFELPLFTLGGLVSSLANLAAANHCYDQALLRQKAMQFDCMQPGCPNFDPHAPGGPCAECDEITGTPHECCPDGDESNLLGYVCCACCDPQTGQGCGAPCPGG